MSASDTPRPDDDAIDDRPTNDLEPSELDELDLSGDERPVDEAAARAHDVHPDAERPVLEPDDDPVADAEF